MKIKLLGLTMLALVITTTGCSSKPETAREVAIASCQAVIDNDFDEIKELIGEELLSTTNKKTMINLKKIVSEKSELYKQHKVDCNSAKQYKSNKKGTLLYFSFEDKLGYKIKKIDGKWRMYKGL